MGKNYKAVIFDLDGVICHTDQFHFQAWKQVADTLGIYFDEQINHRLRGVSRMESFEIILEQYDGTLTKEQKHYYIEEKNQQYVGLLQGMGLEHLDSDVKQTLETLRKDGVKTAIGSSSKNAVLILRQLGITALFDGICDGTQITNSKPHPEVFLKAAKMIGEQPEDCLVVEDAVAGIAAAVGAGMDSAWIGEGTCAQATYQLRQLSDLLAYLDR